ncbi:MAG: hypothetical protein ACI31U_08885 [Lactobacillus crispatus]
MEKPTNKNDVVVIYKLQNGSEKLLLVGVGSHPRLFHDQYSAK